jgi:hypothetical protein
MLKNAIKRQHTNNMNIHAIVQTAAEFNSTHDYDVAAALKLTELVIRHAHTVQLARKEAADPQLALPLEVAE